MSLARVIDDIEEDPHRERDFYEYPELYDFYHSRALDRDLQVDLLKRHEPDETDRVLELGCGTGPLLARIEDEYDEVVGVDADERMLAAARERVTEAELLEADFTEWSAADEGRTFDTAALLGGLLHLTDDRAVASLAANVRESLREGGAFVTFFQPFDGSVENGSWDVQRVESERFSVERRSVSALTSAEGRYTTTYVFVVRDRVREREARMGSVLRGRFHDPEDLTETFADAGFTDVEVVDGEGPTVLRAVK